MSSTGAPSSTGITIRTPSDGELIPERISGSSRAARAASGSSTSKATWGTLRIRSWTGRSPSNRVHSIPRGLDPNRFSRHDSILVEGRDAPCGGPPTENGCG